MSPSRVTIMTETYAPVVGGGEAQAERLAVGLVRRGVGVTLVTRRVAAGLARHERRDGVDVRRVPPAGRGSGPKWALAATALPELLGAVGRTDALVACGYRILGLPARAVAAASRLPCVFKADSQGELSGEYFRAGLARAGLAPDSALLRPLCSLRRRALSAADAYVAISSPIAAELRAEGIPSARIHAIPNGIDPDRFAPSAPAERAALRQALDLPGDAFVACFTGRLVRYKGLATLVAAWERVAAAVPGAALLLVGEGGLDVHSCEDELRRDVEARGLRPRVRFVGAVRDVAPYLRASDAFVFPTEREAFGLSLVEAMACGLGCVTTAVDGLADFIEDGRNALVVRPGAPDDLAARLLRLIENPGLGRELGRAARATAESRFAEGVVVEAWLGLLARVVKESRP